MSSFINEGYDEGFALEFNVSMLLEIMAPVRSYIHGTMKYKAKLEGKYMWKWNMKSFSIKTLNVGRTWKK